MSRKNLDYNPGALALSAFVVGRVADIYTTYVGISQGFSESHPVSRVAIDNLGLDLGLACVNLMAFGTSYLFSKTFNRVVTSSLTDRVGDLIFLYGGAVASSSVALSNQLHIYGYLQ